MVGKFPSTGLQASFLAAFGKNWPTWFLPRGDTLYMYQVDLVHQVLWFMARKKGEVGVFASSEQWLSKILKYRTGHCPVPVANVFGLKCRWRESPNPWRVLLPLSASQTKISLPVSGSICSSKSPQQSFRLSSLALNPKWSEKKKHHNVRWSASGLWQPKAPLSNNFSSSFLVNSRQAFGLFPRTCSTRFFLLAANTSLERQNSSSLRIMKDNFNSFRRC